MDSTKETPDGGSETLLVGRGRELEHVSADAWRSKLADVRTLTAHRFSFMTADHRKVRYAAVRLLPQNGGRPLSVRALSRATSLTEARVDLVLDDLQRHLFFLVRNPDGDVSWAFPVTSDTTSHHLTFSSGERLWGA